MAASRSAIRAGQAFVELFADDSKLRRGLKVASARLKSWGDQVNKLGSKFMVAGSSIVAPIVGAGVAFSVSGAKIHDHAIAVGMSAEAYQELGYAAAQTGGSVDGLAKSVLKMEKTIGAAAGGSKSAKSSLAALGLTVTSLQELTPDQQFEAIADRLAGIEDPASKANAAFKIFGRSVGSLLPLIDQGAEGIATLRQEARMVGLVMSNEDVDAADKLDDELLRLKFAFKMIVMTVGAAVGPALHNISIWLRDVAGNARRWIEANRGLVTSALKFGILLVGIGVGLRAVGFALKAASVAVTIFSTALSVSALILKGLIAVIGFMITTPGLIISGIVALGAAILYWTGAGSKALAWLGHVFRTLKEDAIATFKGIRDALAAGDIALAARILWLGVKMEFLRGKKWIVGIWLDIKNTLIGFSYDLWDGARAAWNEYVSWWTKSLLKMQNWFYGIWLSIGQGIREVWENLMHKIVEGWLWARKQIDPTFSEADYNQASGDEEARHNRRLGEISSEYDAKRKASDDALAYALDAEEKTQAQRLADIGKENQARHDALEKSKRERLAEIQGSIDKAREEWIAARADAALANFFSFENDPAPERAKRKPPPPAAIEQVVRSVAVVGTFAGNTAFRLGGGAASDRLTKAAEQTAQNTAEIKDALENEDDSPTFE